jgi:hypothetical protein
MIKCRQPKLESSISLFNTVKILYLDSFYINYPYSNPSKKKFLGKKKRGQIDKKLEMSLRIYKK